MKRILLALVVGGVMFTGAFAFAAIQPFASEGLGAGEDDVASCTDLHIVASYDLDWADHHGYLVDAVDLVYANFGSGDTCDGWDAWVTLTEGGTSDPIELGSCHGVFSGFTASLACDSPLVDPEDVDDIHLVVMGTQP